MRRNWNSKPCPSGEEEGSEGWRRYFLKRGREERRRWERRKGGDKRNGRRRAGRLPWDVLCLLKKMVGGNGYNRVEG